MNVQNLSRADILISVGGGLYRVRSGGQTAEVPNDARKLPFVKSLVAQGKLVILPTRTTKKEDAQPVKGFEA